MENNIIIKTEKLCKQYGEGETKLMAVNNVDLEVRKGEFVAITGESGSGKTTLLNCLGSLDRPTGGSIFVNGKDITKLDDKGLSAYRRKNFGFIFQSYNLIPVLNVEENIVHISLDEFIIVDRVIASEQPCRVGDFFPHHG